MFGDFCYFNRHTLSNQFTPLNIGLIAQYATQQFGGDVDVSLFKSAERSWIERPRNRPILSACRSITGIPSKTDTWSTVCGRCSVGM